MNTIQKGIITLIKSAITGTGHPLPDGFDINEALKQLSRHGIIPLAYTGAVLCGIPKTEPAMQQMFQIYLKLLLRSEMQMAQVQNICSAFEKKGIDYMLLKGSRLKELYPKPELRQMGDADILIREEQYEQIAEIMPSLGFRFKSDNPHEHTWLSDDLYLELHTYMFSWTLKDYYSFYADSWQVTKHLCGTQYEFISHEDEFIYLFTHYAKHYRGGGIGCRHLIDLWVYRCSFPEMNDDYIHETLKKLHLLEFYQNTMDTINVWFGDDQSEAGTPADRQQTEKTEFITEYIFSSGNWGSARSHALAEAVKSIHDMDSDHYNRKRSLLRAAFPGPEIMHVRYPILKKHPALLPIFWLVRIANAILFRRKNIDKIWQAHQHATPDKVESFQQSLDYVGLEFNFKDE